MHADVACLLCSLPPGSVDMVVPVAQATIIAVPIVLRDQIRQGVRAARTRLADRDGAGDRPARGVPPGSPPKGRRPER
jgi:hypothetical protein